MTSLRRLSGVAVLLLWAWAWTTTAAADAPLTLQRLSHLLSGVDRAEARFTETRTMALLDRPLELQGTLLFRAPDYVRKDIAAPEFDDFEIRGDRLYIEGEDGTRTVSLDRHPALRAFADALRGTLNGELEAMQESFRLDLSGAEDAWVLALTPRAGRAAEHIERIVVTGNGAQLRSMMTLEADGDQSLMNIQPVP